ncbi:conserved hypothetical protein [Culex quinquefasciatus]|uniref:Uncharacterized protein n=1 Tax=Culex quinquefasciatus TaxID=7176 RepID=B0WIK9_CULQU|nr:conserved hypothetical protein [Culex quinquefasciatus]|eukprot:XP_001848543.1 conserved hypothetical protein [Culex quinquefasciatus]
MKRSSVKSSPRKSSSSAFQDGLGLSPSTQIGTSTILCSVAAGASYPGTQLATVVRNVFRDHPSTVDICVLYDSPTYSWSWRRFLDDFMGGISTGQNRFVLSRLGRLSGVAIRKFRMFLIYLDVTLQRCSAAYVYAESCANFNPTTGKRKFYALKDSIPSWSDSYTFTRQNPYGQKFRQTQQRFFESGLLEFWVRMFSRLNPPLMLNIDVVTFSDMISLWKLVAAGAAKLSIGTKLAEIVKKSASHANICILYDSASNSWRTFLDDFLGEISSDGRFAVRRLADHGKVRKCEFYIIYLNHRMLNVEFNARVNELRDFGDRFAKFVFLTATGEVDSDEEVTAQYYYSCHVHMLAITNSNNKFCFMTKDFVFLYRNCLSEQFSTI